MLPKKGLHKQASREDKDSYIKAIEITMNTCVLGSEYNETNWKVPLNETKTDVSSSISFTYTQSKKVISFIHLLLADVFDDEVLEWEHQLQQWTDVITTFIQLDKLLQSRIEFTNKRIEEFQKLAGIFSRHGLN